MGFTKFKQCLEDQFNPVPNPSLISTLFDRFRPVRITEDCKGIAAEKDVDLTDFLLGMNLLSRVEKEKKIKSKCNSN